MAALGGLQDEHSSALMVADDLLVSMDPARLLEFLGALAAQQQRLATDEEFFRMQIAHLQAAVTHLEQRDAQQPSTLKQFAQEHPQLLQHMAAVIAAGLDQLTTQLAASQSLSSTVGALCKVFARLLECVQEKPKRSHAPPTAADTNKVTMMAEKGLFRALVAFAKAATRHLNSQPLFASAQQQPPEPGSLLHPLLLMYREAEEFRRAFAAAYTGVLDLWGAANDLTVAIEATLPTSLLRDTVVPTAALCRAVARAHVAEPQCCPAAMKAVCATAVRLSCAVVPTPLYPTRPDCSVLACQEVYEVSLLVFALGVQQLHQAYGGVSSQRLLSSLRLCSSSGSSSSSTSSSSSMQVSPNHQELLLTLLGARELALDERSDHLLSANLALLWSAVVSGVKARLEDAVLNTSSSSAASTTTTSSSSDRIAAARRRQAVARGTGEAVPWPYLMPLTLVMIELLTLMPPFFSEDWTLLRAGLVETHRCTRQLGQLPELLEGQLPSASDLRPLATFRQQSQLYAESLMMQLGPVLLSACRRGEVEGDEDQPLNRPTLEVPLSAGAVTPHEVVAAFASMLADLMIWQGLGADSIPFISIPALMQQDLVLCSRVLQAAFHALPAARWEQYRRTMSTDPGVVLSSESYFMLSIGADFVAEAAAQMLARSAVGAATAPAAARARASSSSRPTASAATSAAPGSTAAASAAPSQDTANLVAQQVFGQLVAGLKYAQFSSCPGPEPLYMYGNRLALLGCAFSSALRILGNTDMSNVSRYGGGSRAPPQSAAAAAAKQPPVQQQLLMFHGLGRSLVAAGSLLQEIVQHTTPDGDCISTETFFPALQFQNHMSCLRLLVLAAMRMQAMLQPGGAAASAVAAGTAAATAGDVTKLHQRAGELLQLLKGIHELFVPHDFHKDGSWANRSNHAPLITTMEQEATAVRSLRAACQPGGPLQQLASFGVACCSAFPQPGVCGNPACLNLDKFSEAALASRGCSGCNKAVKFCSAECHKTAWKSGHKAACAVLKQQQQQQGAGRVGAAGSVVAGQEPEESEQYYSADECDSDVGAAAAPAPAPV